VPPVGRRAPTSVKQLAVAKPAKQLAVVPLPDLALTLIDHTSEYRGRDGVVSVCGFDLQYRNGTDLIPSDYVPVANRVYYFRVAEVKYHETAAQSDSFTPLSQVFLVQEPSNAHDPNAIQVLGRAGECIGCVPKGAAAKMSSLMNQVGTTVVTATVMKSFSTNGKRTAVVVLAGIERDIEMVGTLYVEAGAEPPSDDQRRLKD
jgi:hypothetical protein